MVRIHNKYFCFERSSCFILAGLIVCPSRELAKQIVETCDHFAESLAQQGLPRIKTCLTIGGTPVNASLEVINR